jgi:hypothetical protein
MYLMRDFKKLSHLISEFKQIWETINIITNDLRCLARAIFNYGSDAQTNRALFACD